MAKEPDAPELTTVVEGTFDNDEPPVAVTDIEALVCMDSVGIEDPGISALVNSADDVPFDSADVAKISEPVDVAVDADTVIGAESNDD